MSKEKADIELKEIKSKLDQIEKLRLELTQTEHTLCLREQELMFEFYPEIINAKIERILKLRRTQRGDYPWTSKKVG